MPMIARGLSQSTTSDKKAPAKTSNSATKPIKRGKPMLARIIISENTSGEA